MPDSKNPHLAKTVGISVPPSILEDIDAILSNQELRVKLTRSQLLKELMVIVIRSSNKINFKEIRSEGDLQKVLQTAISETLSG